MADAGSLPTLADVERCGNLLLQAWAPPDARAAAEGWLRHAVHGLAGAQPVLHLLGYRPARWHSLPPGAAPAAWAPMLDAAETHADDPALHRAPTAVALLALSPALPGELHVHQRTIDPATGLSRPSSTFLGRVLVPGTVDGVLDALRGVAAQPPAQLTLTCLTNPHAGLRQPDARWVRAARDWPGDRIAASWRGTSVTLLAGRAALARLREGLLAHGARTARAAE